MSVIYNMTTERCVYAERNRNIYNAIGHDVSFSESDINGNIKIKLDKQNSDTNYTSNPGDIDCYNFNYDRIFDMQRYIGFPNMRSEKDSNIINNSALHIPCIYYAVYLPEIDSILFTKKHENSNDIYLPYYSLSGKKAIDNITSEHITDFKLGTNYTKNIMNDSDTKNPSCIKVEFVASINNIKINQPNHRYIDEYFKTKTVYNPNDTNNPDSRYVMFNHNKYLYDNYEYRRIALNSDRIINDDIYYMSNIIYDTHLVILTGKLPKQLDKNCVLISRNNLLHNYINDTNSSENKTQKNTYAPKDYSHGHISIKENSLNYNLIHDTHYFILALQTILYE